MSAWSAIEGYISVRTNAHISLTKLFEDVMGGVEYILKYDKVITPYDSDKFVRYKLTCSYCMENDHASLIAVRLIKELKQLKARADLEITLRYIVE